MEPFDPHESLGFHCSLTLKAFVSALETRLKGTGVSPAQHLALAHLMGLGPLTQSELGDRLGITRATAARLVDRMERDGWVVRRPDPKDGRIKRLVTTKQAHEVWGEVSKQARKMLNQAYRGVHPAEIETVKRVLARVRKNLE